MNVSMELVKYTNKLLYRVLGITLPFSYQENSSGVILNVTFNMNNHLDDSASLNITTHYIDNYITGTAIGSGGIHHPVSVYKADVKFRGSIIQDNICALLKITNVSPYGNTIDKESLVRLKVLDSWTDEELDLYLKMKD